jgi:hypothetical protein
MEMIIDGTPSLNLNTKAAAIENRPFSKFKRETTEKGRKDN